MWGKENVHTPHALQVSVHLVLLLPLGRISGSIGVTDARGHTREEETVVKAAAPTLSKRRANVAGRG